MYRVHYAGTSILTGTEIARALLEYAGALAEAGSSATVDVPTVNDDGTLGLADILVGPASQLLADAEDSIHEDVVDVELVRYLTEQIGRLRHGAHTQTISVQESPPTAQWTDYDL